MDTEELLIRASLENWSEVEPRLQLVDLLLEKGEVERAERIRLITPSEWTYRTNRPDDPNWLFTEGYERCLGSIFLQGNSERMFWAMTEFGDCFYSYMATSWEEGKQTIQEQWLRAEGPMEKLRFTPSDFGQALVEESV